MNEQPSQPSAPVPPKNRKRLPTPKGSETPSSPGVPTREEIGRVIGFLLKGGSAGFVAEKAADGQIVFQCLLSLSFPGEEPYVIEDTIRLHGILEERNAAEAVHDFDMALRRVLKPLQNKVLDRLAPVVALIPETGSVFEGAAKGWPVNGPPALDI